MNYVTCIAGSRFLIRLLIAWFHCFVKYLLQVTMVTSASCHQARKLTRLPVLRQEKTLIRPLVLRQLGEVWVSSQHRPSRQWYSLTQAVILITFSCPLYM